MSDRKRSSLLMRIAVPAVLLASAGSAAIAALPSAALAAPTTPPSAVQCSGTIAPDPGGPAAGNANPFDYSFSCAPALAGATNPTGYNWAFSGDIWSYSIIVTRRNDDNNNVTYEAPTANVLTSSGAVDATQYVNCSSFVPE